MTTTIARTRFSGLALSLVLASIACAGVAVFSASAYVPFDLASSRVRGPLHFGLLVGHVFTGAVVAEAVAAMSLIGLGATGWIWLGLLMAAGAGSIEEVS